MRSHAIFKRILLQRRSDKRSLGLLFFAPLLILSLMYLLLQVPSTVTYRIGMTVQTTTAVHKLPQAVQLHRQLAKNDKIKLFKVKNASRRTLNRKNLDAVLVIQAHKMSVTYANQDTSKTQAISSLLTRLIQMTQEKTAQQQTKGSALQALPLTNHYLYGRSNLSLFDSLAPVLVSFFVFFFVFLISGISLVNERSSGTLMRMLVTPVKRSEIVTGYTLAYGLLALVQTVLVVLWARYVLQMQVIGKFAWVLLINVLIALIALLMGLALSAFSKTEFQFVQFIPLAVVPQFLFSGIINVDTMSQPLQGLAHIMPLYYGVDALQKVIKQGMGFSQIRLDLLVLFGLALLLYFVNVFALKALRRR